MNRVVNFYPGPAALPLSVLEQAQKELIDYAGSGMSVMELSHRSEEFEAIIDRAEKGLRRVMNITDDYAVIFVGGGASLQFSMVPMNLFVEGKPADLIHTGTWTKKALTEIKKVGPVNLAGSGDAQKFMRLPKAGEIKLDPNASFVYLCSNNTIEGTQWHSYPDTGTVPLVGDFTSDILSQPVDVKKFGLIFAGAQKNLGPAGVTAVVIKKSLADRAPEKLATMLQYRTHIKERSLYNTPPTFPIYMTALTLEWVEKQGGVPGIHERNVKKAKMLYDVIDAGDFYKCPVEKSDRSLMNVVFRIRNDETLEKKFAAEAKAAGLIGLEGHRSVGGMRASIYNPQTVEGVAKLAQFMTDFEKKNR
ncbi:MAG: 3-phosphoserine/phosphohydroxythreonine transaminase [Elusimicrobia bacterium]|nr:3-phosphoserine/phosphohydroxythreonine transaminase [Elusimicrobiota bacterium]